MKKFRVFVNGEAFEVEIEEVGGAAPSAPSAAPAPAAPAPAPAMAPAPAPKPAAPKPAAGGAGAVTCPLPGTVFDIKVNAGQAVKTGQVLMVIEAMKMENDIVAPSDGAVKTIHVKKGDSVQAGDVLVELG